MSDLDSVIINLKACLVSTKHGIPLSQIENDYFRLNGERIPFKNLGYSSLETLLHSSGKFSIENRGGVSIVHALATNKTQHLTDLIKRQKSKPPKKKPFISKTAPRNFNTSYNYNRHNNYVRGNNSSSYGPPQPIRNKFSKSTENYYEYQQQNSYEYLSETKTLQQNNISDVNAKNGTAVFISNGVHLSKSNGKFYNKREQQIPHTSSNSSIESTFSSNSASYTSKPTSLNTEKNFNFKLSVQQPVLKPVSAQNMHIKLSTAQSRLQKYPKKCDESLYKDDCKTKKLQSEELSIQTSNLEIEDVDLQPEVIDDKDYIDELETYVRNLNLSEPYYECMVKKEKSQNTIKLIHICTIKVNEKSISSSFPVECNTVEHAKRIAAKHALTVLKNQYGDNVVYPITNDINIMASRIKEFLKSGFEATGLMGDVLERMYREQFQENLPDNWVQLLEVYSYFTFDKLVANKIIIYLNEIENNSIGEINGYLNVSAEEENIVPGTPLMFEDYEEKSVLVSANYGPTSVWIRFVGQSADENFIQMQAKFNNTMNTTGFNIAEEVIEGQFYAVLYNSSWHRVQVSSPTEDDGSVTCFMVDTGEQLNVSKDQICHLEPAFMKIKTQAIECILTQFDNFGSFAGLKELLDELILNKTFFVIPDAFEHSYTKISLYEKRGVSERVNVNNIITQKFFEKCINRLPSFEENSVVDGLVSSVVESGYLYLQLNLDVVSSLEEILPSDKVLVPEFFLKSKEDVNKDQVYLLKYEDDIWSRVKVVDLINDSMVRIIYIDYGNMTNCEITNLVNLQLFDPLMTMIPPQAIKVSMNLIPPSMLTKDVGDKIYNIVGSDKVLVNLINAPTNDVPCIQLYKIQPEMPDIPLCINVQLAQSLKKQ